MIQNQIIEALKNRYATKVFDTNKKVSDADLQTILESARLAPSSFGIEAWKFLVVNNPEIRAQLRAAGYDQPKFTDASHLIVLARRTDSENISNELIERTAATQSKTVEDLAGLKQMVDGSIAFKTGTNTFDSWTAAQTYIALGIMVETAALMGIDSCPMEGFDAQKIDETLGLADKKLATVTILALGYTGDDAYATLPKTRRNLEDVVEVI